MWVIMSDAGCEWTESTRLELLGCFIQVANWQNQVSRHNTSELKRRQRTKLLEEKVRTDSSQAKERKNKRQSNDAEKQLNKRKNGPKKGNVARKNRNVRKRQAQKDWVTVSQIFHEALTQKAICTRVFVKTSRAITSVKTDSIINPSVIAMTGATFMWNKFHQRSIHCLPWSKNGRKKYREKAISTAPAFSIVSIPHEKYLQYRAEVKHDNTNTNDVHNNLASAVER